MEWNPLMIKISRLEVYASEDKKRTNKIRDGEEASEVPHCMAI